MTGGRGGGGAGEQLVPGGEGRLRALHVERERRLAAAAEKLLLGLPHHLAQVGGEQNLRARVDGGIAQPGQGGRDDIAGVVLRPLLGLLQKVARFRDLDGHVAARGALDFDVAAQRAVPVHPCLDGELVAADPVRQDRRLPPVVAEQPHRLAAPFLLIRGAPQHLDHEQVVSVDEHIGSDGHGLADHALGGKSPALDAGNDAVDHNARRRRELRRPEIGAP